MKSSAEDHAGTGKLLAASGPHRPPPGEDGAERAPTEDQQPVVRVPELVGPGPQALRLVSSSDSGSTVAAGAVASGSYSFATCFENADGRSSEELVGDAHAGCYSMALAHELDEAGHTPVSVRSTAEVHFDPDARGRSSTVIRTGKRTSDVKREITGYHRDEESDWVAHLACGRQRHVRHNPPRMNRPWVTTPEGRERFLGRRIDCGTCDTDGPPDTPVHDDPIDRELTDRGTS